MEVWEYVYRQGIWFWKNPWVTLLLGLVEGIMFLWYAHRRERRDADLWIRILTEGAFLLLCCYVESLHLPAAKHGILMLALFFLFLRFNSGGAWGNICFECGIFCLLMEVCKLLCKDGLLSGLLLWLAPGIPELAFDILLLVFYVLLLFGGICLLRRYASWQYSLSMTAVQTACLLFPLFAFLFVRQIQFSYLDSGNKTLWIQMEAILSAMIICTVIVIFTMGRLLLGQVERNNLLQKEILLREKQQQYLAQKEVIEVINRKYHDLKHYLTALESMDSAEIKEYARAMRSEIEPFERMQETGNEIMDALLSERIRECHEKGIRLVPFVDGRDLGFLGSLDLCAIFGNAMDNAVEATEKLHYVNMREINVKIGASDGFLVMRFHNYYEGEIKQKDGKILSSKQDAPGHGYGLENIRALVGKYGGTMDCEIRNQEFEMHIVIPLPPLESRGGRSPACSGSSQPWGL